MNADPDSEPHSRTSQRIECRPSSGHWLVIPFLVLAGLFPFFIRFFPDPTPLDATYYAICAAWAAFTWPLPLALVWWLLRGFIIADETGISWRGMGRRYSATWLEVEDYWLVSVSGKTSRCVQTSHGKFSIRDMRHTDELCSFIQEHAQWAKSRQWQAKEPDFGEGRYEFAYGPKEPRRARVLIIAGVLCIPLMLLPIATSPRGLGGTWHALRDPLSLISLLLYLMVGLSMPLLCVAMSCVIARAVEERRDQRISVDEEGLTFESRAGFIRARWDEVTDYYAADLGTWLSLGSRYVVVTKSGTFDFVRIDDAATLRALIKRYATSSAHSNWHHERTSESLVSEAALWSGGSFGVGQRIYGYRNRTFRAILLLGAALTLIFLAMSVLSFMGINPRPRGANDPITPLVLCLLLSIPTLLGIATYYRSSVRTDERGLEKCTPFSRHFLAWSQVRELHHVRADKLTYDIVKGDTTIRFSPYVSDVGELYDEISRRTSLEWDMPKLASQSTSISTERKL